MGKYECETCLDVTMVFKNTATDQLTPALVWQSGVLFYFSEIDGKIIEEKLMYCPDCVELRGGYPMAKEVEDEDERT